MNKRNVQLVLALMLIASMLLSACAAPATPAPVETEAPVAPTEAAAPAGFDWKQVGRSENHSLLVGNSNGCCHSLESAGLH